MVARVAYFEGLTELQAAASQDNWERRFKAALTRQPGLIALFHTTNEDGVRMSFSVWESSKAAAEAGMRAKAAPLLPGQDADQIPGPTRTELWAVTDSFVPATVRSPAT
ncbi:MAG: hypothetical protein NVS3B24_02150 [Candidatus Dormibacteria bacterium]